jgi:DNA transposition AAA+ family ATPase
LNDPDNFPIDVPEIRDWANAEKARRNFSWTQFANVTGVAYSTLSLFCSGRYAGSNETVARKIFRYRQMLETQTSQTGGLPVEPGYFETPTSLRLRALLVIAQMGRITLGATGAGTGKTMTIRHYQASVSNCWVATMKPTTKSLNAMIGEVMRAIGGSAKTGWTRQLSHQVADMVAGKRGLLVIDEANNLELEAIEEIRSWHDATGVGVCFLGNEELLMRIEGGPKRDAYARLNSRIAQRHIQSLPMAGDIEAFCDAWGIQDSGCRRMLGQIALTPGAGGLREMRQLVESASMLAEDEGRGLTLADLRDAQGSRATRYIKA